MSNKLSTYKNIAFVVGSNKIAKNTSSNTIQYQNYDFNQDIEQSSIQQQLKKPAVLLFGDEQIVSLKDDAELYKISIKKDIRTWAWYEHRSFKSYKELNQAIQNYKILENVNEKNSFGEIKTTPDAISIRIKYAINSTNEIINNKINLQYALSLWISSRTKEALPILNEILQKKETKKQDKAIAYNLLAEYYSSRNQWGKVIELCTQSINHESQQKAAFMLCSNAHKNLDDKEQAYNMSLNIPETDNSALWFDINVSYPDIISFKVLAAEAFDQVSTSYSLSTKLHLHLSDQNQILSIDFIDRLIIQSIELNEIENAKKYLLAHLAHPDFLRDKIKNWSVIDKLLSFFIEKKAYDFAITIYGNFIENDIQASLSRRRMVALLIKTGQLNLARQLSTNSSAFFT